MTKLKKGSAAYSARMSRIMKDVWANRRNRDEARKSLFKLGGVPVRTIEPVRTNVPVTRFVAVNYCPNCGYRISALKLSGHPAWENRNES